MMNKIYKVIWNAALQCWVAVSELGKAKGKTKSKKVLSAAAVLVASAIGISSHADAAVNYATGTTYGNGGMAIGSSSEANTNAIAYGHEANARALEDVAIGYKTISGAPVDHGTTHVSAQASVAVGTYANATHVATTAIGAHASAINNFATAVGAGALANKENGSAFGQGAMATGVYATALGKGALAKQDYSVALGKEAAANTQLTTSIGSKTNATGFSAIAIGSGHVPPGNTVIENIQGAQATADDSMAVGASALANQAGATALGKLSKATNKNAVAVGPDSKASGSWATATGASANASGEASAAFGESATASGKTSIATGSHASASGENAIASGKSAIANKNGATAVGANTEASGDKATALGDLAKAKNNRATALGHDSQATGAFSTAAGVSSRASGVASVATGKDAKALADNTIAIGAGANATSNAAGSLVIGRGAVVNATDATVVGPVAQANGANATAVGRGAAANGIESTALGRGSLANGNQSTALGKGSQAKVDSGVALGDGAVADRVARKGSEIVINNSKPSASTGFNDQDAATSNSVYAPVRLVDAPGALQLIKNTVKGNKGAVSVGDSGNTRQIINVAPGSADSDAVNVAQLKAVAGGIKKYSVTSPDNSITITPPATGNDPQNFKIKMNTTAVQNAAAWNIKSGSERGNGEQVRGGQTVTFAGSDIINVVRNGKTLTFNANISSISNGSGANEGKPQTTDSGNKYLAKTKNVVDAINASGWILQANGNKVGLVNPGDKVNIKAGTGVTITPTNEANGISTLTISAAQQNYSWKLKEDSQTAAQALNVTNNTAVSLKGENYLNITNKGGGNFAFKTVTADVAYTATTGAVNAVSSATGLVTNKNLSDVIRNSGFQLKENGKLKNVVNPGESLNFKPGQGTTVSVDTNGDVQVNANVADIQAGNNVTVVKGNNGVVTINANDTNTQASVANGTGLTLTESNNSNGTKKYTLGVNVDNNTIKVENGKLVANLSNVVDTNTQSTVEAKANNFVTVDGSTKNTNGTTKYQVGVTTGDVAVTEATGAVTAISAATGVATNKTVADAIAKSGFQLQENGTLRNVVNPGEILNFKPGKGTTVSVGKNGDVQINANVAGITAGKNITTNTDTNGNVTINAKDTSAHVKAANNAAVKVDKAATTRTENNADITDYIVDLTDQTKTNITHGVNANETVTNKGLTFNGNTGSTGIKKLGSEVDVKGNTSNNVITTTANTNGITIDYNGTAAAQVTSLTYKANNANSKSVTLAKGLDFTNGTQTTAEVGDNGVVKFNVNTTALSSQTTSGQITVPNGNGLVTAQDVANAINAASWGLNVSGATVQNVKAGDFVNFANGNGTTVTYKDGAVRVNANVTDVVSANSNATITRDPNTGIVTVNAKDTNTQASVKNGSGITVTSSTNANGTANYTVAVNVDGSTITVNNDGKLVANVPDTSKVSLTNNAGKVGDVSTADANKFVTGDNLAKTINATYWKASQGAHEENTSEETTGVTSSEIKPGDELTFVSGKNMALKKEGNKFVYATKDDVTFNNVTANNTTTKNLTVNKGGNVDMGGNQVHNVSTGTALTDAVNVKQLYDTVSGNVSTESVIKKAGDDNIAEVSPKAGQTVGGKNATYEVSVSKAKIKALANETVKVNTSTAANNPITVTPHTENGNTTYTVNFDGAKAAAEIPLTYKSNGGKTAATNKTVKLSDGLDFTNGSFTTAEIGDNGVVKFNVNTTALSSQTTSGQITVPNGNGLVTAQDVANAINAASWGLNVSGATVQNVKAGDFVNFANGNGTTVTYKDGAVRVNANVTDVVSANSNATITRDPNTGIVTVNAKDTNTQASVKNGSGITVTSSTNANGTANYTVAVNVDGSTITVNNDGKLVANVPDTSKVSLTNNAGKVGDVSTADANKFVTGDNLAKTINATYWKASQGAHEENTSEETTGVTSSEIKPGDELTFVSGKNMALKKEGNKFVYATKDDVTFNNVTANNTTTKNLTVNKGGNVDMGGNQVHNVSTGTALTDAVNVKQLYDTVSGNVSTESVIKKAGDDNIAEVSPKAGQTVGGKNATYEVSVSKAKIKALANETVKVNTSTAANNPITVTPHTENGNTTYTVNFDGAKAAAEIPLTYKANDGAGKTVKLSEGLNFKNGTQTTAEVGDNGVVKFNVNTTALSSTATDGKITVPTGDGLVTAKEVANAINASYWKANAGGNVDGATIADNVTTGTEVFFAAGKNLKVKHSANNFTFSTADDVSFNNVTTNNLTVNAKGNVDMGGNQVHNVANGTKGTDAVNLDQLNATTATANAGWVIKANGTNATTVKPNATVSLNNTDGNILITKNTANNNVTFNFNPNATFGVVGKDGKDGVDGSIGVNGKDGASVVIDGKDGSIGLTGPKGKDGVSVTLKPEKGTTTVNAKDDGKEIERIKYTANGTTREVATLDDGLKFAGDDNKTINRTLGSLLNITGGATDSTTANNIRVTNDGKNGLRVQLANNVTFDANGSVKVGDTTVNNGGLTITGGPSITKDGGVNAGDKVISNVSTGVKDNDAVNVKQLKDTVADSVSTESVVAKTGTDNIAEVSPKAGQTLGDKNAQYEVSVSKAKVKDAAVEAVKVNATTGSPITVTKTADAANNSTTYTVNFNGDNAAKEIPLTYKSNGNASTAKTVKLSDGLDFTNGTLTTAVVGDNGVVKFNVNQGAFNTTTADANGKLNNASKEGVSTVEDVIKAVNAAGWVVTSGNTSTGTVLGTSREVINPGDAVKFIAGQNVDITQDKGNFTIATRENVSFTTVTVGKDGKNGKDGLIGVNGTDGASVVINGKDGSIGLTGPKGADGKDGVSLTLKPEKGTTTVNEKDANKEIERIKYTANGTTREVATLDDGLKFAGDDNAVINRTLGSLLNITGGADETTLTDNNIGVVYDKATDGLKVKLAKDVNLTSNGSVTIGNTTLNNNGFTITNKADPSKTVSVTDKGLNNGGNTIINVAPGVNGTDAVNLDQLNATTAIANAGWVIKANGTNATTVKPNATVSLNNTDGNILITKNTANNDVTFNLNPNTTFGVKGKDGVDGSIGVNGKDGSSVVINGKDGSIGLNGKDGKNGLSIKGDQGPAGVDGKDGETKTRIVYEYADPKDPNKTIRENVATLNDGLRFTGNNGVENAHRLNTLVTIVGEGVDKAASANFTSASGNINVKADGKGTLEVQLAKNLKNIETINNGNSTITLNKDGGTTISGGDVSVDGNKVTNVKDGDVSANSKDAVNGSQLYHVMTNATAGWNLSVNNGKDKGNVKPGAQVDLNNTDGNIIISKTANNVTFNFNPNATFGVKGKDGKDGVDGSIGVNGKDGASVVINGKDGSIGLTGPKGADGKDGASANMSVQKGTTTVNTDRDGGKDVTRIVYTDKDKDGKDIKREVATLDDGLKFKGDSEQVINRTLGSQMNITGGADSTKLTDNNIGVVYDEATNGLKVKLSKDVDLGKDGSITIGGTQVTNNGLTIKNGPSVTEKGVDAGNKKVTNVADGDINATSKDAVNGSQLYQAVNNINKNVNAAKTELEEGDNVTITSRVGNNGQTIYKVSSTDNSAHVQGGSDAVSVTKAETTRKDGSTTVTDYTVDLSSKTKDDIKKGVDAHDTVTNKGLTFNADKGTTGAKKLGSQVAVNGDNKNIETVADTNGVKVKLKDDINVNSVTANTFKAGDTIVNTKGVQVAAKDDRGNNTNVVINEKGINAGNTRIQNVAAGRADTDAVNVSQLKGAVTQIGNHINKMDKNLRAGIAGAMAAGGLYHATLPGKSMVAAGAGTYKGESAVAVGYSRLSDNGKVGIKFSVNTNTRGDSGAAASVGYQW